MTDNKLSESAHELAQSIMNLESYQDFVEANESVEQNEEAMKLLAEVRHLENKIVSQHQNTEDMEQLHEEQEHLNYHESLGETQEKLNQLDVMQNYNDCAENLTEDIQEIDEIVREETDISLKNFL